MLPTEGVDRVVEIIADTSWINDAKGTKEDPYLIKDADDLYGLSELVNGGNTFLNKFIVVTDDIVANTGNASDWEKAAPLNTWTPIGHYDATSSNTKTFAGTFDGGGNTISGLYVSETTSRNRVGLFAKTAAGATIKDLRIVNSYFEGHWGAGAVTGAGVGTFSGIYSEAIVKSTEYYIGGIIGQIEGATTIENCWNAGPVSGPGRYAGGIAGIAGAGTVINNCLNSGAIAGGKGTTTEGDVGGMIGVCSAGLTITNSLHVGTTVNTPTPTTNHEGGVIGHINGGVKLEAFTVKNVYYIAKSGKAAVGYCNPTSSAAKNNQDIQETKAVTADDLLYNGIPALQSTAGWFWEEGLRYPVPTIFEKDTDRIIVPHTDWYENAGTGVGTADNPYLIKDAADLYGLAKIVNGNVDTFKGKYVKLAGDITINVGNAADWAKKTPLNLWTPIGVYNGVAFEGTFDGGGNTISGVYAKSDTISVALFANMTADTTIGNFKVVNSYFEGKSGVGAIGGWIKGGVKRIYSIYTDAIVRAMDTGQETGYAGGILGVLQGTGGTIENCWNAGTIYALRRYVGGIVGYADKNITINNCLNTGELTADSDNGDIGGLIGGFANAEATITNSLHVGTLHIGTLHHEKVTNTTKHQGGVIGKIFGTAANNKVTIQNVYYIETAGATVGSSNIAVTEATAVSTTDLASKGVAELQNTSAWCWEEGMAYPVLETFKEKAVKTAAAKLNAAQVTEEKKNVETIGRKVANFLMRIGGKINEV